MKQPLRLQRFYKTLDYQMKRKNAQKYCWIYGTCDHKSKECRHKVEGYQNQATKSNMLGESKAYCSWRCESDSVINNSTLNSLYNTLPVDSYHKLIKHSIVIEKGDSEATNYYWWTQDKYC